MCFDLWLRLKPSDEVKVGKRWVERVIESGGGRTKGSNSGALRRGLASVVVALIIIDAAGGGSFSL